MSSTADWFRQRLGVPPQNAPQAHQEPVYGSQPPQGYQQTPQYQQASQQPAQQQQMMTAEQWEAQRVAAGSQALAEVAQGANFNHAAQHFRGSRLLRASENETCPSCGDVRYFSRAAMGDARRGTHPAPLCMACGYSPLLGQQSGSNPVDPKAPVQVDSHSMKHITHYDKVKAEWVTG